MSYTRRRPLFGFGGAVVAGLLVLGACSTDSTNSSTTATTAVEAVSVDSTPTDAGSTTAPATTFDVETADLPLLLPTYLPDGVSVVQASVDESTLAQFGSSLVVAGPKNALVVVATEPGDGTPALPDATGTSVSVRGLDGRYFEDAVDGGQSLVWIDGDHLISLGTRSAVPRDDLLGIAGAVTVGDDHLLAFSAFGNYRAGLAPGTSRSWAVTATGDSATVNLSVEAGDEGTVEALSAFEASDHTGVSVTDVDVAGVSGHLITYDGSPSQTLLWHGFGALVMINADLSTDELIKVAVGLQQVDDAAWHAALDPYLTVDVAASGTWQGGAWQASVGYDAQGWCGELASSGRAGAACDDSDADRTTDVVWLIDPPHHGIPGERVDLDIFGVTRFAEATRVELRSVDGVVIAGADVVATDLEPYRSFALWPDDTLDPEAAEEGDYALMILDDAGQVLATHTLVETDVIAFGASDEQWAAAPVIASGPQWEVRVVDTIVPVGSLGLSPVDAATGVTTQTTPSGSDDDVESICIAGPGVVNGSCIPQSAWASSEPMVAYTWGEQFQSLIAAVVSVPAGTTVATAVTDGGIPVTGQIIRLPDSVGVDLWVAVFPLGPDHGIASVTIGDTTWAFPGHAAPFFEAENPCGSDGVLFPITPDEFVSVSNCGVGDTAP